MTEALRNRATGKAVNFSASSAKTFKDCPRKWFYAKVMGEPDPSGPAAAFGNVVHDALETWMRGGPLDVADDLRKQYETQGFRDPLDAAQSAVDLLVAEGYGQKSLQAEIWLPRQTLYEGPEGTMAVVGKVDLSRRDPPRIDDYKTKSGDRYIETPESIVREPQLRLYTAVLGNHWGLDPHHTVDVSHIYIWSKRNGAARRVEGKLSMDVATEFFERQRETARTMLVTGQAATPDEVRANRAACSKYGGCPFRSICSEGKPQGGAALFAAFNNPTPPAQEATQEPNMAFSFKKPAPAPEPPKGVTPPDAAPQAAVTSALLGDARKMAKDIIDANPDDLDYDAFDAAMGALGVPEEWYANVLAPFGFIAEGLEALEGMDTATLDSAPAEELVALAAKADAPEDEAEAAPAKPPADMAGALKALIAVHKPGPFGIVARTKPPADLRAIRPYVDADRQAIIDEITATAPKAEPPAEAATIPEAEVGTEVAFDRVVALVEARGGPETFSDDDWKALTGWYRGLGRVHKPRIKEVREEVEAYFAKGTDAPAPAPEPEKPAEAPAPKVEAAPAPAPAPKAAPGPSTLYVGCRPLRGAVAEVAADWKPYRAAIQNVEDSTGAAHWTLHSDYGDTGPKRVLALVTKAIQRDGLPDGGWHIDAFSTLATEIVELWLANGGQVVRGTK